MKIYKANIEGETLDNNYYRRVVSTTDQMQLVLMFLQSGEDIGTTVYHETTQFIRVEGGYGVAVISDKKYFLKDADGLVIPAGVEHNIISTDHLKLCVVYAPPKYPPNTNDEYQ